MIERSLLRIDPEGIKINLTPLKDRNDSPVFEVRSFREGSLQPRETSDDTLLRKAIMSDDNRLIDQTVKQVFCFDNRYC